MSKTIVKIDLSAFPYKNEMITIGGTRTFPLSSGSSRVKTS